VTPLLNLSLHGPPLIRAKKIGIPLEHGNRRVASHFHALLDHRTRPPHFVRGTASEIVHDPALILEDIPFLAAFRTLAISIQHGLALSPLIAAGTANESAQAIQHAKSYSSLWVRLYT
jgi:hypothetical protein